MAPTETIQIGLSERISWPTTPPSTPTLSDDDASEILAAMKMHPTTPCYRSELLPFAQQVLDLVKSLSSTQRTPAVLAAADEVKAEDPPVVSHTSVPQGLAQPLTIHDLKDLIKELVESKQAGSA